MDSQEVRLLFVCPTANLTAGGEISNFKLINYLRKKGFTVGVITPRRGDYNRVLNEHGIYQASCDYTWWGDSTQTQENNVANFLAIKKIINQIREFRPNIVITNTLNVPWGAFAAAIENKPHIWIAREFSEGEFSYLDKKMGFVAAYSNVVVANSRALAESIENNYKIPAKYFYSYTGIEGIKLDSSINVTRIVSPNGITHRKNQKELIEAIAILKKRKPGFNTKVILIGHRHEEYWAEVQKLITGNKLESFIEHKPFTNDPWSLVGENDILVQTSLSESIGRTTTEAMKLGIPVIASSIPGHIEAFKLGGGTLYESGNPEDLATKIDFAISNKVTAERESQRIKNKALKNMSEERCSRPFIHTIESLKGSKNPQGVIRHVAYLMDDYLESRESAMKTIQSQSAVIDKLQKSRSDIINSKRYRIGDVQVRLLRKFTLPIRFLFQGKRSKAKR